MRASIPTGKGMATLSGNNTVAVNSQNVATSTIVQDALATGTENGGSGLNARIGATEEKKTNWLLWIVIALTVVGIAYGSWYYYKKAK